MTSKPRSAKTEQAIAESNGEVADLAAYQALNVAMLEPGGARAVMEWVQPEWLPHSQRLILEACVALEAEGRSPELVGVLDWIKGRGDVTPHTRNECHRVLDLPGQRVNLPDYARIIEHVWRVKHSDRLAAAIGAETDPEKRAELGAKLAATAEPHVAVENFHPTDLGNAERFTAQHGERVRYVAEMVSWFVWSGKCWARDRDDEVRRLAAETVRAIYGEAGEAGTLEQRKTLATHAARSEAERRIAAMLELAHSMKPIATVPETFDSSATRFVLNVENGALDLRTGEIGPHRRADYITKLAPATYDPAAQSDQWERFLARQVPDPDVRAFLQRAVGYTLTGDTGEEVLFFVHGPEAAGKSTFTEAIKAALGEYAATTDFETFLKKRGDAGVRHDIARLAGARMVLSLEVDEGRHLAEALIKNLTGGDTITARHLYQKFFEYRPAFKLWLVANHQPRANAEDGALWRRILLVPFMVTVPEAERDPGVKHALKEHATVRSAILAWAVQGCVEWQRTGLRLPDAVRRATASYREACDHLGAFLTDTFGEQPPASVTAKDLRERYQKWCEANGERPARPNRVSEGLRRRGVEPGREGARGTRIWVWPRRTDVTDVTDVSVGKSLPRSGSKENLTTETSVTSVTSATPNPKPEGDPVGDFFTGLESPP